jgi:SAM-dependent methyltransferase
VRGVEEIPWLYDLALWAFERLGLRAWREWLAGGVRGLTLDLGSGTGRNLPLFPRGTRAVAVDPHPDALARARRRAPGVLLVAARAEALPFREATFDTVVCGLVLCSVDDPRAALGELRRVLRADGTLRLLEHVRHAGVKGVLQDLVQPAWTAISGGCRPNRETEATVVQAGFEVVPGSRRANGSMRRLAAHTPARGSARR